MSLFLLFFCYLKDIQFSTFEETVVTFSLLGVLVVDTCLTNCDIIICTETVLFVLVFEILTAYFIFDFKNNLPAMPLRH